MHLGWHIFLESNPHIIPTWPGRCSCVEAPRLPQWMAFITSPVTERMFHRPTSRRRRIETKPWKQNPLSCVSATPTRPGHKWDSFKTGSHDVTRCHRVVLRHQRKDARLTVLHQVSVCPTRSMSDFIPFWCGHLVQVIWFGLLMYTHH